MAQLRYPGTARYTDRQGGSLDWHFVADGFAYLDASIIHSKQYKSILVAFGHAGDLNQIEVDPAWNSPVMCLRTDGTVSELDRRIRGAAEDGYFATTSMTGAPDWSKGYETVMGLLKRKGSRFLVSELGMQRATEGGPYRITREVFRAMRKEWSIGAWSLLVVGDCPTSGFDFKKLVETVGPKIGPHTVINEVYLDTDKKPIASPTASMWMEILPVLEIPFDLKVRSVNLKQAYEKLSKYVQCHEAVQKAEAEKPK